MERNIDYALLNLPLDSSHSQLNIPKRKEEFDPKEEQTKKQKSNIWNGAIIVSLLTLVLILSCVVGVLVYQMHLKNEKNMRNNGKVEFKGCFPDLRDELCIKVPNATKDQLNECKLCPAGWKLFMENCYYISSTDQIMSWNDSQAFCKGMNSHLLVIESEEQMPFLDKIADSTYWIGLYFDNYKGNWTWINVEPFKNFQLKFKITPGESHCVVTDKKNYYSEKCDNLQTWICQRKAVRL